jgi:radical SAM superfamily enzyme YgiQ (UPF0313 family)
VDLILKILLVYPEFLDSFWGFKHSLSFVFKKAVTPPLGLLTIANLFPSTWDIKLINMNVQRLKNSDVRWADLVFISAIQLQAASVHRVIQLCKKHAKKIVAGGPLFATDHSNYPTIDHFILNEAEITLPDFLKDWQNGQPKQLYTTTEWADLTTTPLPRWELIKPEDYFLMNIQYSRGCPFNCDFCDITKLFGTRQRTKSTTQILSELELIYATGWQDQVLFVDDNFIGNKNNLKHDLLPALANWMKQKKFPFTFYTQVSLNLADDEELMRLMADAGFNTIFVGIETTHEASLLECTKKQNINRNMVACVHTLQKSGFQVQGGFIVGFDNDPPTIFQDQIDFIQKSGIVTAMVGILQPLRGTRLFERLEKENRMHESFSGNNTDGSINFIPRMKKETLIAGYQKLVKTIYSPAKDYTRIKQFFSEFHTDIPVTSQRSARTLLTFARACWELGIRGTERRYYWKHLSWIIKNKPKHLRLYVMLAIFGYHHRKYFARLAKETKNN